MICANVNIRYNCGYFNVILDSIHDIFDTSSVEGMWSLCSTPFQKCAHKGMQTSINELELAHRLKFAQVFTDCFWLTLTSTIHCSVSTKKIYTCAFFFFFSEWSLERDHIKKLEKWDRLRSVYSAVCIYTSICRLLDVCLSSFQHITSSAWNRKPLPLFFFNQVRVKGRSCLPNWLQLSDTPF